MIGPMSPGLSPGWVRNILLQNPPPNDYQIRDFCLTRERTVSI